MPTSTAAKKAPAKKVPASPPVRVEIRVAGRVRFSNEVYDPQFELTEDTLSFSADLKPTMVAAPETPPPTRFRDQTDVRDQEGVIQRVHSGRRDVVVAEPEQNEAAEQEDET